MNILLVEDDAALARGLQKALRHAGFSVNHVNYGQDAIDSVAGAMPDIVVLDLGLPDMDGLAVLKQLRNDRQMLPVLILTAREGISDKVTALDSGADDYLSKPFEIDELLARLRVLARRLSTSVSSAIVLGGVTLDTASHQVAVDESVVVLSRREYMLLKALMENAGRIQTR
ncbi:MAG: DNA-binding response regulator, partial [Gammaproteobacteria bacterium]